MHQVGAATGMVPPLVPTGGIDDAQHAEQVAAEFEGFTTRVEQAGAELGRRQAAATVVRTALEAVAEARRLAATAEERAADAERRWEESRARRIDAERVVETQREQLWSAVRGWAAADAAPPLQLPAEITPEVVDGLAAWAAAAAAPALAELRAEHQTVVLARDRAAETLADLARRRKRIEREADPAPPEPPLARTPRTDGAPLWRLVDFADGLSAGERAGLEAALQASGLLDAWVRPDGAVLDAEHRDTVLPSGPSVGGPTLAGVLRPDPPPDAGVTAEVTAAVLSRVGLGPSTLDSWLDLDGGWRLGALQGRAGKEEAQYVGATARAAERRRRLREIDDAIARARHEHERASTRADDLTGRVSALEEWVRQVPATQPLLQAWARLEERTATVDRDERDNSAVQQAAHRARLLLTERIQEAEQLAHNHDLPAEPSALAALEQRLRDLADGLRRIVADVPGLVRELKRWAGERAALDADAEAVASLQAESAVAEARAEREASALAELEAAVGATVRDLQRRLDALRDSARAREQALGRLTKEAGDLRVAEGKAEEAVAQAESQVAEHRVRRAAALGQLAELAEVPGLLESAFSAADPPVRAVLRQVGSAPEVEAVPAELTAVAGSLADLLDTEVADVNLVWRTYNDATSGPAADYEPRVSEFGELVAVTGRDEGKESPIGELAYRVAASVEHDRQLLTQRERERFEHHILGELGDAIRRRRLEAEELVEAMNGLLAGVTTSQGIRVKLDWRLRDGVPPEAAEAVRLLAQPVGALLPEERSTLRDALHRLIEMSRAEHPELSYGEHLSAALDYREWSAFKIRYTRPETEGRWLDLHKRSALSQGEQKVLCYLPLFAAAAAHFESLAGAAPHAPRLVLLDDAFPKIDVRTHPLLFGLLVQLDLDFVITSERLWGDHETVPSLAIYEALRDPSQRGIAQYEYRWDGRQLRAIG
jgi:uncharacterized protein (TIGR02680 family)